MDASYPYRDGGTLGAEVLAGAGVTLCVSAEMQKHTSGTSTACVKFPSWCKNSGGERDGGLNNYFVVNHAILV